MENLTAEQLRDAVVARLAQRYEVLDINPAAIGITRTSVYVDLYRVKPQRIAPGMYECTATAQITIQTPLDAYGLASHEELLQEQLCVMELFRAGYLRVGDRAPRVELSAGGIVGEQAYVDLALRYVVQVEPDPENTGVITNAVESWGGKRSGQ